MEPTAMETITTAFTTGIQGVQTNMLTILAAVIPVALMIYGASFAIKKGVNWFNSLTHK